MPGTNRSPLTSEARTPNRGTYDPKGIEMKKSLVAVLVAMVWALAACGGGSASAETGVVETSTTVPADPTSYAAQEWATFRLADLPVRFYDLEEKFTDAYTSMTRFAYSPDHSRAYRAEVSPLIHEMDTYMDSLQPAIDILNAAAKAGARDNDLADLAPELVMFHSSLTERLADLHELHDATLAFDGDRWDEVASRLQAKPFPFSYVCAYLSIASEGRWASRFTDGVNAAIAHGDKVFECSAAGSGTEDDAA